MELKYLVETQYGDGRILLFTIVRETPQRYYIDRKTACNLYGNSYYIPKYIDKHSGSVFNTLDDAKRYLISVYVSRIGRCQSDIDDYRRNVDALGALKDMR
jgi:hypothetical protein